MGEAQERGVTLLGGLDGEPGRGLLYRGLVRLWKRSISLYGRSVTGMWKGGFFTGDPEGYVEKVSGDGHLFP